MIALYTAESYQPVNLLGKRDDVYGPVKADKESSDQLLSCPITDMRATAYWANRFNEDTGPNLGALLSLLMTRGLPLNDKSERDDKYRDKLQAQIDALSEKFNTWAVTKQYGLVPVEQYKEQLRAY